MPHDLAYLITRQRQSTELAAESGDVAIRIVHQKMADQYAARIKVLTPRAQEGRRAILHSPSDGRSVDIPPQ